MFPLVILSLESSVIIPKRNKKKRKSKPIGSRSVELAEEYDNKALGVRSLIYGVLNQCRRST